MNKPDAEKLYDLLDEYLSEFGGDRSPLHITIADVQGDLDELLEEA